MTDNEQMRALLEREGMVMTREQDAALKEWLDDNDARMYATIEHGHYVVLIFSHGGRFSGSAESCESLADAVERAKQAFDAHVVAFIKARAPVVGEA